MKDKIQLFVLAIRSVDNEIQTFRPESHSEAELAEKLNEPVTDMEPTAEAPAQESYDEPTNPESCRSARNQADHQQSENSQKKSGTSQK